MALLVYVNNSVKGNDYSITVMTEQGNTLYFDKVSRQEGMTAAESVELYMLDRNMVASWSWSMEYGTLLVGQFVAAP